VAGAAERTDGVVILLYRDLFQELFSKESQPPQSDSAKAKLAYPPNHGLEGKSLNRIYILHPETLTISINIYK
jgi:hypothetical protein